MKQHMPLRELKRINQPPEPAFPVVLITRNELSKLYHAGGYEELFPRLRSLSEDRGLIYHPPKRGIFKEIGFRSWFDSEGNLCQQNYLIERAKEA